MDGEVKPAFSRRPPTKHFSAQLDIKMYGFVYVLAGAKSILRLLRRVQER